MKKKIVGLGEVLWDILPERTCLGGAPANFAYITTLMGEMGIVASRVGQDPLGSEALCRMQELGLGVDAVQTDLEYPTGTVNVEVDDSGLPRYEIAQPVAWDFLAWTPAWQQLAETADAVCFGSLAQRSETSRETIRRFLQTSKRAVKIFDVNLRQSYYSQPVLDYSMKLADIVKLNDEELPKIMALSELPHQDERSSAQKLVNTFDLKLVCVTRGGRGSLLVTKDTASEHAGFHVKVADTVGSGDAYTAGLVHEYLTRASHNPDYLNRLSLDRMNEVANRVGAWVASEVGAMPIPEQGNLERALAEIR
jgi:fructokinase